MNESRRRGFRAIGVFGTAMAVAISFTLNKSILWATLAGFFGWAYVLYVALFVTY